RLRSVTKRLGAVRELDVTLSALNEAGRSHHFAAAALRHIGGAVTLARAQAFERVRLKLPAATLQGIIDDVGQAIERVEIKDALTEHLDGAKPSWLSTLDARLTARAIRVRGAIEAAGSLYAATPLHDLRIAIKKLRYGLELSADAGRDRARVDVQALKAAQQVLGEVHDLEGLRS